MFAKSGMIVATLLTIGCASMAKRPLSVPPPFPLDLGYSSHGTWVHIEIDQYRVVTLDVTGQKRAYGKISPEDFVQLRNLVTGTQFRDALRELGQAEPEYSQREFVTLYGYREFAEVTYTPVKPRFASYTVRRDQLAIVPEAIGKLLALVDSSCGKAFGAMYVPILGASSWKPNHAFDPSVCAVTVRAQNARTAPAHPAGLDPVSAPLGPQLFRLGVLTPYLLR